MYQAYKLLENIDVEPVSSLQIARRYRCGASIKLTSCSIAKISENLFLTENYFEYSYFIKVSRIQH